MLTTCPLAVAGAEEDHRISKARDFGSPLGLLLRTLRQLAQDSMPESVKVSSRINRRGDGSPRPMSIRGASGTTEASAGTKVCRGTAPVGGMRPISIDRRP